MRVRGEVREILRAAGGATALLVTHDQDDALSLADHLLVKRDGEIVQAGTPATPIASRPPPGSRASWARSTCSPRPGPYGVVQCELGAPARGGARRRGDGGLAPRVARARASRPRMTAWSRRSPARSSLATTWCSMWSPQRAPPCGRGDGAALVAESAHWAALPPAQRWRCGWSGGPRLCRRCLLARRTARVFVGRGQPWHAAWLSPSDARLSFVTPDPSPDRFWRR